MNDEARITKDEGGEAGGCLPVAVAAAVVCVLLAIPGILMAVLGLLFGGAR